MSDTNCTRAGYDSTGRYHVPEITHDVGNIYPPDQCPDCRCAPNMPHSPDCDFPPAHSAIGAGPEFKFVPSHPLEDGYSRLMAILEQDEPLIKAPNLTLDTQVDLFEARKWDVLEQMRRDLDDPEYLMRLFDAARKRLIAGFSVYGSTMYGWDNHTRNQNEDEEMADRLVYGTSEDTYR